MRIAIIALLVLAYAGCQQNEPSRVSNQPTRGMDGVLKLSKEQKTRRGELFGELWQSWLPQIQSDRDRCYQAMFEGKQTSDFKEELFQLADRVRRNDNETVYTFKWGEGEYEGDRGLVIVAKEKCIIDTWEWVVTR